MIFDKPNKGKKGEIIRNRTIRPSTREASSKSYKIDTKDVGSSDTLIVNIDHESKPFFESYTFTGTSVANKKSISFRVYDYGNRIDISWSGASPVGLPNRIKPHSKGFTGFEMFNPDSTPENVLEDGILKSFDPIFNENTKLLILGTMPGADSFEKQEYYANPRNNFWKLLEAVLSVDLNVDYPVKKKFLLENGIGIWDVCMSCLRDGSLDSKIENETPNDLVTFIADHPHIKTIAFNGKEAAKLFGKHFGSIAGVKLIALPSSSPANAAVPWDEKLSHWLQINKFLS